MNTRRFVSFILFAAICISLLSGPSVHSQSSVVTTTTTITQPSAGQCSEISLAFWGQAGKEIVGTFGSDASISFYILSPSDFAAINNPTCSLLASSRPLYSEMNIVGYDNSYRSLPFPADGTYYFVFILRNSGQGQLANGYAAIHLTFPASTSLTSSISSTFSPAASSSNIIIAATQSMTQSVAQSTTSQSLAEVSTGASTVAPTGPSFGIFGVIGLVVVVALIAAVMMFIKRERGLAGQTPVLTPETVKQEIKPEPTAEPQPEVPQLKPTPGGENISTGYPELDKILAGGLPVGYAILIVSPPCDERDLLFRKIIESSLLMGSQIFFLSRDLIRTQDFANRYRKGFHIFSPQADKITSAGGKVYKIHGLQNLSDLNISFTKAVEDLPKTLRGKLIIIDLLSDILLEHKALTTRKWLDGFIGKRKTEGFTIIGVLNPLISSPQDAQTIMDLFDGIIEIYERELKERARRFLIVKKLYGRKYIDTELMLDKDKLY
jgi:archaellum biogenesis ATPase FlaH